jgi:transcriptional regulator with XRE-family HTH domain
MADDLIRARREIDQARRLAGLSLADLGQAGGLTASAVMRILNGTTRLADMEVVACLGAAVGLDVRLRVYPAGDPIRDAGQARLLERLRLQVHPSLRWRTEVPLPIEGDLRAWDATIRGSGWLLAVEAETVVVDVQALERKLGLKQRFGGVHHLLLLVADTPRNRQALSAAPAAFQGWPLRTREILCALRAGRDPGAGGIVFL